MKAIFVDVTLLCGGTLLSICSLFFGPQGTQPPKNVEPRYTTITLTAETQMSALSLSENLIKIVAFEKKSDSRIERVLPITVNREKALHRYVYEIRPSMNYHVILLDKPYEGNYNHRVDYTNIFTQPIILGISRPGGARERFELNKENSYRHEYSSR